MTRTGRHALVVWGGWEGHAPASFAQWVRSRLEQAGLEVTLSDTLSSYEDPGLMSKVGLIVQIWTMGELNPAAFAGLEAAVRSGAGFAGFHGGMGDSFRSHTEYQFMVGGQFVAHPGGIVDYEVQLTRRDDPIVAGLSDFSLRSEQYYMHVDPHNEVLATTTFSGEHGNAPWIRGTVMPVVWKRRYGEGKIFYASYGHTPSDLDVPAAGEILRRGMLWARTNH